MSDRLDRFQRLEERYREHDRMWLAIWSPLFVIGGVVLLIWLATWLFT